MPQSARLRSSVAYAALNSAGGQRTLLAAGGLEGVSGSRHVFSSINSAILKGLAQVSKWRVDWANIASLIKTGQVGELRATIASAHTFLLLGMFLGPVTWRVFRLPM